jgi:hypothetical protein
MQNSKNLRYTNMIILTTAGLQTFPTIMIDRDTLSIVPLFMEFTNETTKEVVVRVVTTRVITNDILYIGSADFSFLRENIFYNLKVYLTTSAIVYKDRVFCTNQSQSSYSINNGQYVTPTIDNNSYITI